MYSTLTISTNFLVSVSSDTTAYVIDVIQHVSVSGVTAVTDVTRFKSDCLRMCQDSSTCRMAEWAYGDTCRLYESNHDDAAVTFTALSTSFVYVFHEIGEPCKN